MPAKKKEVIEIPLPSKEYSKILEEEQNSSFSSFALQAGSKYRYVVKLISSDDKPAVQVHIFFAFAKQKKDINNTVKFDKEIIKTMTDFLIKEYVSLIPKKEV